MTRIPITEGLEPHQGAFTGQVFETDTAQHWHPPQNRGEPLILWRTAAGTWVLSTGNISKLDGRRAVVVTEARAAAILDSWGHALPEGMGGVYEL